MTKSTDLRYEAGAIWVLLQHFPGAVVLEAPVGMRAAVLKIAKKGAA